MPVPRIIMRKIKDNLCLKMHTGLSHEQISQKKSIERVT
jgi:hypothetical protein